MKKAFDDYTFLAGSTGMKGSLWKGPDHLLVIEARGFFLPFSEVYRRIDYKNIQALTLTETRAYVVTAILLTIPIMIMMAIAISIISADGLHGATWGLVVAIVTTMGLLAVHLARGRTCVCSLQTAVLSLRLKPLKRKAKSNAVIEELAALCRHHQGELPAELPSSPAPPMPAFGQKAEWLGSTMVRNTMIVALIWGALMTGELFVDNTLWLILGFLTLVTTFFMAIPSLVRVSRARTPGTLVVATWSLLATTLLGGLVYAGMFIASMIALDKVKGALPGDYVVWMASLGFSEAQWGAYFIIGTGVIAIFLGLLGLPSTFRRRSLAPAANQVPPPSASPL